MAMKKIALFIGLFVVAAMSTVAHGIAGTATANTVLVPSACDGYNTPHISTAVSAAFWNGGAACGDQYTITCVSGTNEGDPNPCIDGASITVTVADYCPPAGCQADFDIYSDAYATIANMDAGKINIDYVKV